jgi:hypothetical protein
MNNSKSVDLILIFYNNKNIDFMRDNLIEVSECFNKIFLINNGSKDDTLKSLKDNFMNNNKFIIHDIKENIRYGGALKKGFALSESDYIFWSHGDTIIKKEFYEKSIDLIHQNNIFIKGLRLKRKLKEYFFTKMLSIYASVILRNFLSDISAFPCGIPRANKEEIILKASDDYTIELYIYFFAIKNKLIIERIPVQYFDNGESQSTWTRSINGYLKMIHLWLISIKSLRKLNLEK